MTMQVTNSLEAFAWKPEYEAEKLVHALVGEFLEKSEAGRDLAMRMKEQAGTRFGDWVDYIELYERPHLREKLASVGYVQRKDWAYGGAACFVHEGAMFPIISLNSDSKCAPMEVAIKVESIADFAATNKLVGRFTAENKLDLSPTEPPLSRVRRLIVDVAGEGYVLSAVERHGYRGMNPPISTNKERVDQLRWLEQFRVRDRHVEDEAGFERAEVLIDAAIEEIGRDVTCEVWFAAEREYWMRRNRAAQVQYARQQRLGLGWANHDHHTYRSSRKYFARLVGIWEKLGFVCRERFYAGREAGWGAQVMEQPVTGIITFNDVDLSPDELMGDFAHEPLSERKELGTVGLWCGLHGESFLQAGMHHLEAQFDFEALRKQLEEEAAIKTMKPFTDFPYLRQAFTEGERWKVAPERIEKLLAKGQITPEQAKQFREAGAIGSHLENLERNAGFKGFNQKGVSEIISATDPRKQK